MPKIKILTPQDEFLAELDWSEVGAYLHDRTLAARKISTRAVINAFDKGVEIHLAELKKRDSVVIRSASLNRERVLKALLDGRTVFINPSRRELRHFHGLRGFILSMERLTQEESPVEILIPAGQYGDRLVFAFRKV